MQFIYPCSKRKNLFFTQLQIKMMFLFFLIIYAVTGAELEKEDAMKVIKLEQKQTQWIKEHRQILKQQMPFLNDILNFESQHFDKEIKNANLEKITNHIIFRVIFRFFMLEEIVQMYTINKHFYNFIRTTYNFGGDKVQKIMSSCVKSPILNASYDLTIQTEVIKMVGKKVMCPPLSVLYEHFPYPYTKISLWRNHGNNPVRKDNSVLRFTIQYRADIHRLHIYFPTKDQEESTMIGVSTITSPIIVDSVFIPGILFRMVDDAPSEVHRLAWFDLPLHDCIENSAKELNLEQELTMNVIYRNVDTSGKFITFFLSFPYDSSRKSYTFGGMYGEKRQNPEMYSCHGRPLMFPEIRNKRGPIYIKNIRTNK